MDFVELYRVKAPTENVLRQRIQNINPQDYPIAESIWSILHTYIVLEDENWDGLRNSLKKIFKKSKPYRFFVSIFGEGYLEKIIQVPVLQKSDNEALKQAEIMLTIRLRGYSDLIPPLPKKPSASSPPSRLERWDNIRAEIGARGYREIAKRIREFLELGEIGLSQEDRQKMRGIFRQRFIGEQIPETFIPLLEDMIFAEFTFFFGPKEWLELEKMDPTSQVYKWAFGKDDDMPQKYEKYIREWARYRYDVEMGNRPAVAREAKFKEAKRRVAELEKLAREQPMNTENMWQLEQILLPDWTGIISKYSDRFCTVCSQISEFICGGCRQVAYCGKECQQKHWHDGKHNEECE